MRARAVALATLVVLAAAVAVAAAQQPAPTVTVNASSTSLSLTPPGPVAAGPTRFEVVRAPSERPYSVFFGLLVPGVTLEEFQQALASDDRTEGSSALGLVSIQGSAALHPGETRRAVTFTVRPGVTYVMLGEEEAEGDAPPKRTVATFTSSATANGAAAPAAAATVRLQGLRFRGDRVLPRNGVVRFENRDGTAHFAFSFPLRPGVTRAQLGRALRSPNERAFGRISRGAPYVAQHVLSGGNTVNFQEVTFPRRGRFGLVCFIDGHERLGMYRVVSVR